jgi:phosphoglycolate phosphatase-like HAD superfamily hydrolase
MEKYHTGQLRELQPRHDFFIGIDSDGCAFDTMEIKQKKCFVPNIVKHFGLEDAADAVRECVEFFNLYSRGRGTNRFPALLRSLDHLRQHPKVVERGIQVPELASLRAWVEEETQLGHPSLERKIRQTGDKELARVYAWSRAVNADIEMVVQGVEPFTYVRESLNQAREKADLVVISQTPVEALEREWGGHQLDHLVLVIAGQEYGTKAEQLEAAAGGKYKRVLMMGDAPGDLEAARAASAQFYPILPGDEDRSWERFLTEGMDRFFEGNFCGNYQQDLIEEFEAKLPVEPPWKNQEPK